VRPDLPSRRTAVAAVAAGALLCGSVAAEIVWPVQSPDGTVTHTAGFLLYVGSWTAGAIALVVALLGLPPGGSRAATIGRWISLAGAVLLAAFGVIVPAGAMLTGAPPEASFLLFAVGLLLLGVGAVPLGLGLRGGALGGWEVVVLVGGAGALLALLAAGDPWHDLGLFVFDAAWLALGLRLLSTARRPVAA
jgi:hypothetical protein